MTESTDNNKEEMAFLRLVRDIGTQQGEITEKWRGENSAKYDCKKDEIYTYLLSIKHCGVNRNNPWDIV